MGEGGARQGVGVGGALGGAQRGDCFYLQIYKSLKTTVFLIKDIIFSRFVRVNGI
jgi:hypothetical protein